MTIHPCTYAADRPPPLSAAWIDGLCAVEVVAAATAAVEAEAADEGHGENVNSWSCGRGRGATGRGAEVRAAAEAISSADKFYSSCSHARFYSFIILDVSLT